MVDEQALSDPTRAHAGRRRSSWCRCSTRCRSCAPPTTWCWCRAAATGWSIWPAAGLITGDEVIRYSASLHGRRSARRDRRPPAPWSSPTRTGCAPTTGGRRRTSPATPRRATGRRRCGRTPATPASTCSPTPPLDARTRLGAGRPAQRRGHVVRRAVRLPPGGAPGDGDRRRPEHRVDACSTRAASTSRSRPTAASTTSRCCSPATGSTGPPPRRRCASSVGDREPFDVALDERSLLAGQLVTFPATDGADHGAHRARATPPAAPAGYVDRTPVGFAEADFGHRHVPRGHPHADRHDGRDARAPASTRP